MAVATVPPLKIAVLHYQPSGEKPDEVVEHISTALKELGHKVVSIGVYDRVFDLLKALEKADADLVFNACETFANDYRLEVNVAAVMEMAGVKFTGSGTAGLLLAQDKILTKQLLEYHHVPTARFVTFQGDEYQATGKLKFPLIVKPARTDSSIGIDTLSVVKDWDELHDRVRKIRKKLDDEALAEEFIDGREVYVGVVGTQWRLEILPVVELDFGKQWDPDEPKVSDRDVKFGDEVEDGAEAKMAKDISPELMQKLERAALLAFRALKINDYARIDFRIDANNEPYVLEVNPNPYLEKESELGMAANERGWSYTELIGRIVEAAAERYDLKVKPEKASDKAGETPSPDSSRASS